MTASEPSDAEIVTLLNDAAERGMAHSDAIADAYCGSHPEHRALARRYLRENLMFRLTPRAIEGLGTFYREAQALGIVSKATEIEFFQDRT